MEARKHVRLAGRVLFALAVGYFVLNPFSGARAADPIDKQILDLGKTIQTLPPDQQGKAVEALQTVLLSLPCKTVDCRLELLKRFTAAIDANEVTSDKLTKEQLNVIWNAYGPMFKLGTGYPEVNAALIANRLAAAIGTKLNLADADLKAAVTVLLPKVIDDQGVLGILASLPCNTVECRLTLLQLFVDAIGDGKVINKDKLTKEQLDSIWKTKLKPIFMLGANTPEFNAAGIANPFSETLTDTKPNLENADLSKAISALLPKLVGSDEPAVIKRYAEELTPKLGGGDAKKIAELKGNKDLKKPLSELEAALSKVVVAEGAKLNIIDAWFGDFRFIRKARIGRTRIDRDSGTAYRACDVTAEVRSSCQGKGICPFTISRDANNKITTPSTVDDREFTVSSSFCGGDKLANVDPSTVGLVVSYQCLTRTKAEWDALETHPDIVTGVDTLQTTIRTGSQAVMRCAANLSSQ